MPKPLPTYSADLNSEGWTVLRTESYRRLRERTRVAEAVRRYREMADTLDALPRLLHAARAGRGLTYREAADELGSTASHLCNIERGHVGIGTDLGVRILRWLGAPASNSPRPVLRPPLIEP